MADDNKFLVVSNNYEVIWSVHTFIQDIPVDLKWWSCDEDEKYNSAMRSLRVYKKSDSMGRLSNADKPLVELISRNIGSSMFILEKLYRSAKKLTSDNKYAKEFILNYEDKLVQIRYQYDRLFFGL